MILLTSDSDNEWLNSMIDSKGNQSGIKDAMSSLNTKLSRPELSRLNGWSVDDELIGLWIESCGSLEAGNI